MLSRFEKQKESRKEMISSTFKFWSSLLIISSLFAGVITSCFYLVKDNDTLAKTNNSHTANNGYKSVKPSENAWNEQSEGLYPDIRSIKDLKVEVSIKMQRVMIEDENKVLYTMYCSTGKDNTTPRGKFTIKKDRGDSFYNERLKEGAKYWTSFSDDNVYLFHSVPTDQNGNFTEEGKKDFGRPASHGCIRLSVPDAEWFMNNIPEGTPVIIK